MQVGERVKYIRTTLKYTQEKFGEKIGLKRNSLSQIESGKNSVTEQVMRSICREYCVNYEWLANESGEVFQSDNTSILNKVDKILSGENEFHKNIIKTFINLEENDLLALERLLDKFIALSEQERKTLNENDFVKEELNRYEAELRSSFRQRTSTVSPNINLESKEDIS